MYDLIIVGAGPAGMTAAVYAARKRINMLIISKDMGGQVLWTSSIENYMGYQYIEGFELMKKFKEQVKQYPVDMKIGPNMASLIKVNSGFEIETDRNEKYLGKTVILAMGKRPRRLDVPGEREYEGKGVTYCATCDGPLFAGMNTAVIGGGNSALEAADDMRKICNHVYLVSSTPLTGDQVLIGRITHSSNLTILAEHEVVRITGDVFVKGVVVRDRKSGEEKALEVGGVLVEIGLIPNTDSLRNTLQLNEQNEVEVDCLCQTVIAGLFAAGDITSVPEKQIVIAAGEGAKAALRAHRYLQRI